MRTGIILALPQSNAIFVIRDLSTCRNSRGMLSSTQTNNRINAPFVTKLFTLSHISKGTYGSIQGKSLMHVNFVTNHSVVVGFWETIDTSTLVRHLTNARSATRGLDIEQQEMNMSYCTKVSFLTNARSATRDSDKEEQKMNMSYCTKVTFLTNALCATKDWGLEPPYTPTAGEREDKLKPRQTNQA